MSHTTGATDQADPAAARAASLLAGPRGRRLVLTFAMLTAERCEVRERETARGGVTLEQAVTEVSYDLDPGKGTSVVRLTATVGDAPSEWPVVTVGDVVARLRTLPLTDPDPDILLLALAVAVDSARYWQEPDGTDVLAGRPEIRAELRRFAAAIARSPHASWWFAPVSEVSQWAVQWDEVPFVAPLQAAREPLAEAKRQRAIDEARALRERPTDATAGWSGEWWSRPPASVPRSTRALADGSPVKLWCVEDAFGWSRADARRLGVPAGLRIFEIDSAAAWAELCQRFPLSVTGEVRHDWFRATGRDGAWVIPDWAEVAEHYDAVHLQVGAYLAAAGTAIAVAAPSGAPAPPGEEAEASVIAGWDADETFWFTHRVRYLGEAAGWVADDGEAGRTWRFVG